MTRTMLLILSCFTSASLATVTRQLRRGEAVSRRQLAAVSFVPASIAVVIAWQLQQQLATEPCHAFVVLVSVLVGLGAADILDWCGAIAQKCCSLTS